MRRRINRAGLYSLTFSALLSWGEVNASADKGDALEVLRRFDIPGLSITDPPRRTPQQTLFKRADGQNIRLGDFTGKYVLVNFWATWCGPCRDEMPSLDYLAAEFADEPFVVLAIASGHNPLRSILRFFEQTQLRTLEIYRNQDSTLAQEFGVLGLPSSILLDPLGREIATLSGKADWFTDDVRGLISDLLSDMPTLK